LWLPVRFFFFSSLEPFGWFASNVNRILCNWMSSRSHGFKFDCNNFGLHELVFWEWH
jgi:hypothetical protein